MGARVSNLPFELAAKTVGPVILSRPSKGVDRVHHEALQALDLLVA
jgi:hypothetical protein